MPVRDFFARMQPEFAQQVGDARDNAVRQAHVARLIAKAEYEFRQLRRELVGLVEGAAADTDAPEVSRPGRMSAKAA